jgi:hypothetical protein
MTVALALVKTFMEFQSFSLSGDVAEFCSHSKTSVLVVQSFSIVTINNDPCMVTRTQQFAKACMLS